MKTPIEYIKEAWSIYTKRENFIFFAKIMAVLVVGSSLLGYSLSYFRTINNEILIVVFAVLSAVFGIWMQSTTYVSIFNIGMYEKTVFQLGYKKMWRYFLILLVLGLIFFGGAILLIIPAFIFGIWYSFSTFLVLDKNLGIRESLKKSKTMVAGNFWPITGRYFVFGLVSFVVSIALAAIPYAGSLLVPFIAPLFTLPFYLLYRDLSAGSRFNDLGTS